MPKCYGSFLFVALRLVMLQQSTSAEAFASRHRECLELWAGKKRSLLVLCDQLQALQRRSFDHVQHITDFTNRVQSAAHCRLAAELRKTERSLLLSVSPPRDLKTSETQTFSEAREPMPTSLHLARSADYFAQKREELRAELKKQAETVETVETQAVVAAQASRSSTPAVKEVPQSRKTFASAVMDGLLSAVPAAIAGTQQVFAEPHPTKRQSKEEVLQELCDAMHCTGAAALDNPRHPLLWSGSSCAVQCATPTDSRWRECRISFSRGGCWLNTSGAKPIYLALWRGQVDHDGCDGLQFCATLHKLTPRVFAGGAESPAGEFIRFGFSSYDELSSFVGRVRSAQRAVADAFRRSQALDALPEV